MTDDRVVEVRWRLAPESFSNEELLERFPVVNQKGKPFCGSVSPRDGWYCSRETGHWGPCLATIGHVRGRVLEVWNQ